MIKKKILTRNQLIKKLTKIFNEYIRLRDNNTCVICGSTQNPTAGHLFSCVNHSTKWDEDNVFCQCRNCNYYHETNAYPFTKWYIEKFGKEKLDKLFFKHNLTAKFSNSDLITMINIYTNKLKELKNNVISSSE